MTVQPLTSAALRVAPKRGWLVVVTMIAILMTGTSLMYCRGLSKTSLWTDEYWALYLATGRGDAVLKIPANSIIQHPNPVGFDQAPPWWKIWTGVQTTTHPPFYHLVLRAWVDLFGDSDSSVRGLSVLLGEASALLLFGIVWKQLGKWPALLSAAIMLMSVSQIDAAQNARPYTLVSFLSVAAIGVILQIGVRGATRLNLSGLAILSFLLALTHYLAIGGLVGLGVYVILRFRGPTRIRTLFAIGIAGIVYIIVWGPMAIRANEAFSGYVRYLKYLSESASLGEIGWDLVSAPSQLLFGKTNPAIAILIAIMVYLLPLRRFMRSQMLPWWMWTVGILFSLAVGDVLEIHSRSPLLGFPRYAFLAAPGIFVLLSSGQPCVMVLLIVPALAWQSGIFSSDQFPRMSTEVVLLVGVALGAFASIISMFWRHKRDTLPWMANEQSWPASATVALAVGIYGIQRLQLPPQPWGESEGDCRTVDVAVDRAAAADDLVIFACRSWSSGDSHWPYLIYQHYAQNHDRPVMLVVGPRYPLDVANQRVWLITNTQQDVDELFPNRRVVSQALAKSEFFAVCLERGSQSASTEGAGIVAGIQR
jgi:hypothetical protein